MSTAKDQLIKKPRIFALNIMRVFIIAAVISTHIVSSGTLYDTPFSGAVWIFSHTSRNLFVVITALVLMYNYGFQKKFDIKAFYLKRFTLVLLPYATWTLIYQIKDGIVQTTTSDFIGTYVHNFLTAGAMYHLYFLIITMQIYLFFPLIRYVYQKMKTSPWIILGVSFCFQLILTTLMHYTSGVKGLNWWLDAPDNYIVGYQLYVVAGVLIAANMDAFMATVLKYKRKLYGTAGLTFMAGFLFYGVQVAIGVDPAFAAAVFQPYLVVATTIYGLALFAFSFQWVKNGMKFSKPIAAISEDSFGIYLSHVLFITYFSKVQTMADSWYVGLATLVIGLPVFYGAAFLLTEIARRTWFSILLTGRKMTPLPLKLLRKKAILVESQLVRAKNEG